MHKILKSILEGLQSGSDKISIVDYNCILYVPSTIEIFMNGHETVFSRDGEVIGTDDDLDDKELTLIYAIRGCINTNDNILDRREKMIECFTCKEAITKSILDDKPIDYSSDDDDDEQFTL